MNHAPCTYAGVPAASGLGASDRFEEQLELGIEQLHILASEYLGNKVASKFQHMSSDVESLIQSQERER